MRSSFLSKAVWLHAAAPWRLSLHLNETRVGTPIERSLPILLINKMLHSYHITLTLVKSWVQFVCEICLPPTVGFQHFGHTPMSRGREIEMLCDDRISPPPLLRLSPGCRQLRLQTMCNNTLLGLHSPLRFSKHLDR